MKKIPSRLVCLLLALMLLMQNLAVPVFAGNDDGTDNVCKENSNGQHTPVIDQEVPATCTGWGKTAGSHCSACLEVLTPQEEISPKGHTEETIPSKAATCTEDGLSEGTKCSVCNEILVEQDTIPAEGHAMFSRNEKAATCTEDGWTAGQVCENGCGYTEGVEVIPALGHKKAVTVPAKAATCTEDGCTEGWKCETCGYEVASKVLPATDHKMVVTVPAKVATCTEDGCTEGQKCETCGYEEASKVLPATGHKMVVTVPAKAATCTEDGCTEGRKCETCGFEEASVVLPATGHTVQIDEAVADTCTTAGKTQGSHCSVCGQILEAQREIKPMGHAFEKRSGTAPTCVAAGKTDYYRCVDCGELLNAQQLPATGIHHFVPVSGNPNDGFTCQVCGKSDTGLTQSGNFPLLPYEQETEENVNGFRLSQGETPVKSAQLQIYRNEKGDYVNVLCLTLEDGRVTYVSFETGSANLGELLTIYLQNAKPAATRAKLEAASQPNFGIGFDESGNPYLYVVRDGIKYAFMVTEPVVETVEIVFGTKDVTTTEENQATQPIQQIEEQKEGQNVTKTENDSTDNTFIIHKFVDPDAKKEEEPEVIIPKAPIRMNFESLGDDEHSDAKHKKYLTYMNDSCHLCAQCNTVVVHSNPQNGVFTCCNGKCAHSEWYASLDNCICFYCNTTKEHNFMEKGSGCECSDCGVYYTKHDCTNTSCSRCGHTHSWKKEAGTLICSSCRLQEAHGWQNENGSCRCVNCGETRNHDYKDGSCTRCGAKCAHPDGLANGTCVVCGYTCSHNYGWARKNGDVCVCKKCRTEEAHHWRRFGGYYICTQCGAFSTKKKS